MSSARVMTPIVFWASCNPCPHAIAADDAHWPYLNPRLVRLGCARRNTHTTRSISPNASTNPTSGDSTIGMTTLSTIVDQWTVDPDTSAAPTSPPIRACDDDDGSPKYHVRRFHAMAPTTAAKTTTRPWLVLGASMMLPTVFATLTETSEPARLKTAARASAARGLKARVDTDVAI